MIYAHVHPSARPCECAWMHLCLSPPREPFQWLWVASGTFLALRTQVSMFLPFPSAYIFILGNRKREEYFKTCFDSWIFLTILKSKLNLLIFRSYQTSLRVAGSVRALEFDFGRTPDPGSQQLPFLTVCSSGKRAQWRSIVKPRSQGTWHAINAREKSAALLHPYTSYPHRLTHFCSDPSRGKPMFVAFGWKHANS